MIICAVRSSIPIGIVPKLNWFSSTANRSPRLVLAIPMIATQPVKSMSATKDPRTIRPLRKVVARYAAAMEGAAGIARGAAMLVLSREVSAVTSEQPFDEEEWRRRHRRKQ